MLATLVFDTSRSEYAVEHGHEEQCEDSRECKTTDNGSTHRAPHLGALACTDSHRHHAEDGGEGSHHHRTQTRLTAVDNGAAYRHTALAVERDIVDEHDTVLHHDTDKHDGADHTHHI